METKFWRKASRVVGWLHILFGILDLSWEIVMAALFTYHAGLGPAPGATKEVAKLANEYDQITVGMGVATGTNSSSGPNSGLIGNLSISLAKSSAGPGRLFGNTDHDPDHPYHSEIENWLPVKDFELWDDDNQNPQVVFLLLLIVWIRTAVWILGTGIQLWAAAKLLSVVTHTHEDKVTLRKCHIYCAVTLVMALLNIANYICMSQFIPLAGVTLMHVFFLFVVAQFMREIK